MKTLSSILVFILSFEGVFAADATTPETSSDLASYERYLQNVDAYCKPTASHLWSDWQKNSLITTEQVIYADITKKEAGDVKYKEHLKKIKADAGKIDMLGFRIGPSFLDKASYVYKETMGAIYACAVMNAKVRIIDNLLAKIPTTQSNIKQKLKNQLGYTRSQILQKGCREVADTSELSVKKSILDNTTYQYCNYRHYLAYLDTASKKNIGKYFDSKGPNETATPDAPNPIGTTDSAASEISKASGQVASEIAHTREVFPQAMIAFNEFEKTYASHILLELILQDYVDLRDSLKKLLNPIGQVIYKASNAQSPGK